MKRITFLLSLLLLLVVACTSAATDDHAHDHSAEMIPNDGAVIRIVEPADRVNLAESEMLTIQVETENYDLSADDNHWHVYLNGELLEMVEDGNTAMIHGFADGHNMVKVVMANADHAEMEDGDELMVMVGGETAMESGGAYADLDTTREKMSDEGHFRVSIEPNVTTVAINELHSWTLTLMDDEMGPIDDAIIRFGGGMPEHNHGFPTEPEVLRGDENGEYLIEGIKMQMAGWWEMTLEIEAGDRADTVTFNIVLP